jgi:hypothetical protein
MNGKRKTKIFAWHIGGTYLYCGTISCEAPEQDQTSKLRQILKRLCVKFGRNSDGIKRTRYAPALFQHTEKRLTVSEKKGKSNYAFPLFQIMTTIIAV